MSKYELWINRKINLCYFELFTKIIEHCLLNDFFPIPYLSDNVIPINVCSLFPIVSGECECVL